MIQSIFILSPTGEVLIERHFRGVTPRSVCDYYWQRVSAPINHHGGYTTASSAFGGLDPTLHDTVPPIMEVPSTTMATMTSSSLSTKQQQQQQQMLQHSQQPQQQSSQYLFSVLRDGLSYLACCTNQEVSPLLVLEFLHRIADTFVDYFGNPADESAMKDNFSTVYQLLEEMVDYGWPLTTEPNALKAMIRPPTVIRKLQSVMTGGSNAIVSDALPSGTISNMPWRAAGVKYNSNEIYIDIVEEIDAILDVRGNVVTSDVSGSIQTNAQLSGVPELLMTFQDPNLIDDCSFHPCVRYGRFENDKVVSFVPPDGQFELMRYRVHPSVLTSIHPPIYVHPQWTYTVPEGITANNHNNSNSFGGSNNNSGLIITGRVMLNVGVRSASSLIFSSSRKGPMMVEDVSLTIPFPKAVTTASVEVTVGTVLYDEATKIAKWTLGKLDAMKKPQLHATIQCEGATRKPESNPNISLHWKIPLSSVSGLHVSGLSIAGEHYRPYKGVRNITKSGRFQVRCN